MPKRFDIPPLPPRDKWTRKDVTNAAWVVGITLGLWTLGFFLIVALISLAVALGELVIGPVLDGLGASLGAILSALD